MPTEYTIDPDTLPPCCKDRAEVEEGKVRVTLYMNWPERPPADRVIMIPEIGEGYELDSFLEAFERGGIVSLPLHREGDVMLVRASEIRKAFVRPLSN